MIIDFFQTEDFLYLHNTKQIYHTKLISLEYTTMPNQMKQRKP